jgi:molybdate transport system substrate-binding protein
MKKIISAVTLLLAVSCLFAGGKQDASAVRGSGTIVISVAASLTDAMNDIISLYNKKDTALTITPVYGSSGSLRAQIEQGAPVDIFFSAAESHMKKLVDEGFVMDGTTVDLLKNEVVLIVPESGNNPVTSFDSLTSDSVKQIAIGEPESVPAGTYAKETLTTLGTWNALSAANKFVFAKDVRQVLTYVEQGEVQAGIVYSTDAAISNKVTVVCNAPDGSHKPVIYPVAIIKTTQNAAGAKAFYAFLCSKDARAVFAKYGFISVK